jgi:hypothetical protein
MNARIPFYVQTVTQKYIFIKERVLSHIAQVSLGCAVYKPGQSSSLKASFEIELVPLDFNNIDLWTFLYFLVRSNV